MTGGFADRPEGRGLVLVVEHEEAVADLERLYLARAGFDVCVVTEPVRAAEAAARLRPVAVVLDLSVCTTEPGDLYALVAAAARPAPVVCVVDGPETGGQAAETGRRGTGDRGPATRSGGGAAAGAPAGRGAGAAEVPRITRPFSPRVLVAALNAALREPPADPQLPHLLTAGSLTVDPVGRGVRAGGHEVELTATEFDLLVFMMRHPGRVYSREQLLATVWPAPSAAGSRTVDVHIAQLRGKLGPTSPIRTVRGVGYAADIGPD